MKITEGKLEKLAELADEGLDDETGLKALQMLLGLDKKAMACAKSVAAQVLPKADEARRNGDWEEISRCNRTILLAFVAADVAKRIGR